jgi:hypothetical protein
MIKRPQLCTIGALALFASVGACAPRPREAPPSAAERIEPTSTGLLEFFRQECLNQRNLAWARQESDRRAYYHCRAFPAGLMTPEGKIGDCESEVGGHVEWTAHTARAAPLKVYLAWGDWEWPRNRHAACGLEVPEDLGPILQTTANAIAEQYFGDSPHPVHYTVGRDEVWEWSRDPPRLELSHITSTNHHSWALRLMVHPNFPENYNFVRDHVMRDCPFDPATNTFVCP